MEASRRSLTATRKRPAPATRLLRRLNANWLTIRHLSRKARARLAAQRPGGEKLREAARIGAMTWSRLLKRLKMRMTRRRSLAVSPLDRTMLRRAEHHLRTYRLWFETQRLTGLSDVPPLNLLHAELIRGYRKRSSYPVLEFPVQAQPVVSIVIPVRDHCEITYHCLCSLLFAYNDALYEVVVVDDGSSDETTTLGNSVRGIDIVRHPSPEGFARAVDRGIARARGEFFVILNNGSEVTTRWLDELLAVFRNFDRVGAAGAKTVRPAGGDGSDPLPDFLRKVDSISGAAAWMISRACWNEIGGLGSGAITALHCVPVATVRATDRFAVYVPTSVVLLPDGETPRMNIGCDSEFAFRVLFIEQEFPLVDRDAGSYAAFQEMRLFQSLGAKVSFLPHNLARMGRHTIALQRIGVECLFAPHVSDFSRYIRDHARDYDLVYVVRHKIAEQVIPLVRDAAPDTRVAFNVADLHFLRERREAESGTDGYSAGRAAETRRRELATIAASDVTFSYSDVELGILAAEVPPGTRLARMPWIVDSSPRIRSFSETKDILFVGGFAHPPNSAAVRFFAGKIMPLLKERLPDAVFNVVGSGAEAAVSSVASDRIRIIGQVPNLGDWLDRARVFVAPLLTGAGLKGKVLDALSHGVPCVLSPIAAEGTGLVHEAECLIAGNPEEWAECVFRLYVDAALWTRLAASAMRTAKARFSFAGAIPVLDDELTALGLATRRECGLPYLHARPDRYDSDLLATRTSEP